MRRVAWQSEILEGLHHPTHDSQDFGFYHKLETVAMYAFHYRNGFLPSQVDGENAMLMDDIFTYMTLIHDDINNDADGDMLQTDIEVW